MQRNQWVYLLYAMALVVTSTARAAQDYDQMSRQQLRALADQSRNALATDGSEGWQVERVPVDQTIVEGNWNPVPFKPRFLIIRQPCWKSVGHS